MRNLSGKRCEKMAALSEKYTVVKEFRTVFNPTQFDEKIAQVLLKYDFLVGDISDNHLRLKGFYHDKRRDVEANKKASKIEKYIKESCNYMCPHYVIEKTEVIPKPQRKKPRNKNYYKKRPRKPQKPQIGAVASS